jgi:hypothetical protein
MQRRPSLFLTASILILLSILSGIALAEEELEMINRPVNTLGLTGLLNTTSPFVQNSGTVEVGVGAISETSTKPDTATNEYFMTVTVGLGRGTELSARGSYVKLEDKTVPPGTQDRGAGDGALSFKWNVLAQKEGSPVPALALFGTAVLPTGDSEAGTNSVLHWGGRLGMSVGREISWEDHVIAIYADASIAAQDLSNEEFRDSYHTVNAGFALPISKYRNLQLVVEYTIVSGRDVLFFDGPDYSAITTGIRLVTERFNLSMATEFVNREPEEYDNASRIVGVLSMKF